MKNFTGTFNYWAYFARVSPTVAVYIVALVIAAGITYRFSPGFMSFDSFVQYRQTLGLQQLQNAHPMITVYLWRSLLKIKDHPGVLLAFWQLIYWTGFASFACLVDGRFPIRMLVLLVVGLCPPVLILSLHLWKDVGMMCSLALAVTALLGYVRYPSKGWLLPSGMVLFFAIAFRINGFIPAVPLLLLTCYFVAGLRKFSGWKRAGITACVFTLSVVVYSAGMTLVNSQAQRIYGLGTLLVWDMASISLAENEDLLPKYLHRSTNGDIIPLLAAANSREANYPIYEIISPYPPEQFQKQLVEDWFKLIAKYPQAYFEHRGHVLGIMLGIHDKAIYYPFHPGIDENEFDISFDNISREDLANDLGFFNKISGSLLYRPWIYLLLGIIALAVAAFRLGGKFGSKEVNLLAGAISLSGLSSAASLLFIATAADYRYITWTILAALLASIVLISDVGGSR